MVLFCSCFCLKCDPPDPKILQFFWLNRNGVSRGRQDSIKFGECFRWGKEENPRNMLKSPKVLPLFQIKSLPLATSSSSNPTKNRNGLTAKLNTVTNEVTTSHIINHFLQHLDGCAMQIRISNNGKRKTIVFSLLSFDGQGFWNTFAFPFSFFTNIWELRFC